MVRRLTLAALVGALVIAALWIVSSRSDEAADSLRADTIVSAYESEQARAIRDQAEAALAANPRLTALLLEMQPQVLVVPRDDSRTARILAAIVIGATAVGILAAARLRPRHEPTDGQAPS